MDHRSLGIVSTGAATFVDTFFHRRRRNSFLEHRQFTIPGKDFVVGLSDMPADVAHISPIVYSLCEQRRLPVLVTDLIAHYLDQNDLLKIGTFSSTLNEQANSILYKDLVLDLSEEHARPRLALVLRTLLTTRTAASNVRSLSLIGHPLSKWRKDTAGHGESVETPIRGLTPPVILLDLETTFTSRELDLYQKMGPLPVVTSSSKWNTSLPRLCMDVLNLLRCYLEDLHISSDYFRYFDFGKNLRAIFETRGFQNLQSCSLCDDVILANCGHWQGRPHINVVRDWDDALLAPFFAPNITSIKAVMTLTPEAVRLVTPSSITRLTLHHCQIQEFDLDRLLAATPRLCYLEYHAVVDFGWYKKHWSRSGTSRSLGLDPLLDAIHHVRDTLTELVTSQKFGADSHHFEWGWAAGREAPFRQCYELSQLKHLRTLVIPFASLLGWKAKESQIFDWHKMLPVSLHHVTFTDDLSENFSTDGWTDESLMPVFSNLAGWLAVSTQSTPPLKFTLRLLQTDTEFHETERQALLRMFGEHGVLCEVEKLLRDWTDSSPRNLPRGGGGSRGRGGTRGSGRGHGIR